jgi:hypothetical protein
MFLYVYSPSDFVSGLPDENGATAAGGPTWTLTLVAGAQPTLIEVTDDDLVFDEVDGSQVLTNAVNIDGVGQAAGTSINTAYDLINTTTGHKLTSFHFGGDGYQQGAVDGMVSTEPLLPGTTYTFNSARTSHQQSNEYDDYVACFCTGTKIETARGEVSVEELRAGDLVHTLDRGPQPVMTVLSREFDANALQERPNLRPVRILAGALGQGVPTRDLWVSPQHRFLARSPIIQRMFGVDETLLCAAQLTMLPKICVDEKIADVTYYHIVMKQHEIIIAEGTPTESFFCGPLAVKSLAPAARLEIEEIFPELQAKGHAPLPARSIPNTKRQKRLIRRLRRNDKPILSDPLNSAA